MSGQEFGYQFCLKSVTFAEDTDTPVNEYISVVKDRLGIFSVPQYNQQRCEKGFKNTKNPVAYVSGGKINISAKFTSNCEESILVRGVVKSTSKNGFVSQMIFPCKKISFESSGQGSIYSYDGLSDIAFESKTIKYFENFSIDWQWSYINTNVKDPCGAAEWVDLGTSTNPMYITLRKFDPTSTQTAPTFFHTLLKFTCSAADCETTDSGGISKIWDEIDELEIQTADSKKVLTYYNEWTTQCTGTRELLKTEDGQCGAFKNFMLDAIKVQGIRHSTENKENVVVFPGTNTIDADEFLIGNWEIQSSQYSDIGATQNVSDAYQFAGIPAQRTTIFGFVTYLETWTSGDRYNWQYSDFTSISGIDGQGPNPSPRKHFNNNHQFTNINGVFMDPSYGLFYTSI